MPREDFAAALVGTQAEADKADRYADIAERQVAIATAQLLAAKAGGPGDAAALEQELAWASIAARGWRHAAWLFRESTRLNRRTFTMLTGAPPRPDLKVVDPDDGAGQGRRGRSGAGGL